MTETAIEPDLAEAAAEAPSSASLYERLGGTYGIAGAVDVLVDRLFANRSVKNASAAVDEHHSDAANSAGYKFLVTGWSIEAAGGPKCYPGRDMNHAHSHLDIDAHGFDAVWTEIDATLNLLGVPDQERGEFMDIIERYRPQVVDQVPDPTPIHG